MASKASITDPTYEEHGGDANPDEDEDEESDVESVAEDTCMQLPDSQEEKDARADKEGRGMT
jgi:hypothetical protein